MKMGKQKTIMLLVTYKCNLRCTYCYEPKVQDYQMNVEKAKSIIMEQMSLLDDSYDSVEIQFMGGEPLLEFPLIKEVSEWIWSESFSEKPIMLFAPTNGTLLTNEMKSWLIENKKKIHLGLSFDGNIDIQNINRPMSYRKVDLSFFVKTWPGQSVKMTISPDSIRLLSDGVIFLHKKGFKHISADLAMGMDVKWTKDSLKNYKSELEKLSTYYFEHETLIPFSMLRVNVTTINSAISENVKTCSCGENMVCVDWTGKTYACHLFSPIAIPIEKAIRSNKMYDFSDYSQFNSNTCSKCVLNIVCNHCYGMNYLCTDNVTMPSPFHCSAFKVLFVANCRFRLKIAKKHNDSGQIKKIHQIISRIA